MQNTEFVYILCTRIVQIKSLCYDECTKNIHQIPTCKQKMHKLHKTCTKFKLKTPAFKLKIFVFVHS